MNPVNALAAPPTAARELAPSGRAEARRRAEAADAANLAGLLGATAGMLTADGVFAGIYSRDAERFAWAQEAFAWRYICGEGLLANIDEAVRQGYYRYPTVAGALRLYVQGVLGDVGEADVVHWAKQSQVLAHPDKTFSRMHGGKEGMRRRLAATIWEHHQRAAKLVQDPIVRRAIYAVSCPNAASFPTRGLLDDFQHIEPAASVRPDLVQRLRRFLWRETGPLRTGGSSP